MDSNYDDKKAIEILESCRINPQEEVEQPPVAIQINSEGGPASPLTLGNFSMVIGKAKSKKTFLIGTVAAAAITGSEMINVVQGTLSVGKRNVLYFDTEQSRYHVNRTIKRITWLSDIANPENLIAYGLRKFKPDDRLRLIEKALYMHTDVGLVFIDGGRDLLSIGINNEEDATNVTSNFLRWTEELDIHLCVVLHQNKNDNNARGHFGSECVNKAETTISVTQDANDRNVSVVRCEFSRDIPFADFAFRIDENGNPVPSALPARTNNQAARITQPSQIDESTHKYTIRQVYGQNEPMTYEPTWRQIKSKLNDLGIEIGDNTAKDFLKHYQNMLWIKKSGRLYALGDLE